MFFVVRKKGGTKLFKDISIEELLSLRESNEITVIDVRSQSEYKDATIPGSMNIPFFNNEEREEVGTLYKQVGEHAAKEKGLELVSSKLPELVKEFSEIEGKKAVFCWRGGMRSKSTATVLDLMGIKVLRLNGGYRSYRNWVVEQLDSIELKPKAFILNGYTGSGKTKILNRLKAENFPVIDLEGMANHRGSIFGQIGMEPSNQKKFDALLIDSVRNLQQAPYVLLEGEGRRIGRVSTPPFILKKLEQGITFFIEMPREERIMHILEDYQPWNHEEECLSAFLKIKKRIHTPIAKQIELDLKSGNYSSAVGLLLEYYYDPLYDHSTQKVSEERRIPIKANNIEEALNMIRQQLSVKQ